MILERIKMEVFFCSNEATYNITTILFYILIHIKHTQLQPLQHYVLYGKIEDLYCSSSDMLFHVRDTI